MAKISKLTMLLLILFGICVFCRDVKADTSIYVFGPDQSIVVKTGGFVGLLETYTVTGQYRLTVDSDAAVASFEQVDANLTDETGAEYGRRLNEIFNMTALSGTIIDETTIEFEGKTADGTESDVRLKLNFTNDFAHLTGNTTPPPNSADMFFYDVNAVAVKKYAGGTGEPNNPYQIATAENLIALGEIPEDYDKHFILTADIDLDPNLRGRKVFDKAVIAPDINDVELEFQGIPYAGIFDGNGHTISHLTIQGLYYLGLFGQLESGAKVRNLGVVDVNIVGSGSYVGGLAGENSGEIFVCYSTGVVHGGRSVGGLVGYNSNNGDVTNCSSSCMVSGFENIGGLMGHNYSGRVTRCFSTGLVAGVEDVGGLVGDNDAQVNGSLWDDNDTNIIDSFWDIETSTRAHSEGGIGKTTAEMQTASTFLEAGWDFVGETDNGTEDIWWILEGQGYPRLWWEIPAKYAGGTGEPNNNKEDADKHFKLMADIDLSGYTGTDFNMIGTGTGSAFAGVFDGNGHVVKNFSFTDPSIRKVGLFSMIGSTSEIKNIHLVDARVEGRTYVGLLVGYSTGTVSNCSATGNVQAGQYTGGLIGINSGALTQHCRAVANVSGSSTTGGLVGANS
ncbi:MAG: GLUG motif-containing protein, partial [Planctomycetota bacterium]